MFDKYDEDGSGTIDFYEFAELITSFNRERYTKVFQSFDVDGSGELDADEVRIGYLKGKLSFYTRGRRPRWAVSDFGYNQKGRRPRR